MSHHLDEDLDSRLAEIETLYYLSLAHGKSQEQKRHEAIRLWLQRWDVQAIADELEITRRTVRNAINSYIHHGANGLRDRRTSPRRPMVTLDQIRSWLADDSFLNGAALSGSDTLVPSRLKTILADRGVEYTLRSVRRIFNRLGLRERA